jgi:hypothetical protein
MPTLSKKLSDVYPNQNKFLLYFEGHDLAETFGPIQDNSFTIFIAHTPAIYQEAATYFPQLYLCGHTHARQVHLPYLGPVITHCNVPKEMVHGKMVI